MRFHPMYLSELTLLFGWIIYNRSVAALIAFVVWHLFFNSHAVPIEERTLEAHFGEAYLEYKSESRVGMEGFNAKGNGL